MHKNNSVITANYYVRKIPQGQYLIAAGLEQVVHYILNLRWTDATLDWIAERGDLSAEYLDFASGFPFRRLRFRGSRRHTCLPERTDYQRYRQITRCPTL